MKYGVLGEKLPHSFSKEIHEKLGRYTYDIIEVAKEDFKDFAEKRDFTAINITIPYKRDIIPYLYYISEQAKSIGAVNVAINKDGKLYGYNTDFIGLKNLILRAGFDLKGAVVLILGYGGTSRTAHAVAEDLGASVIRFVECEAHDEAISYADAVRDYANADFIIDTSPCGMYPKCDGTPWDGTGVSFDNFPKLKGLVDVVYNPLRTTLASKAQMRGIPAVNGLYMLVSQAVAAAELFLDEKFDDSVTENIYKDILHEKENIVLTGMPGSGKSTIGKLIAEALGREFIDTDEEFTKKYGAPADYINANGEAAFRNAESEIIKDICADKTGAVISTGGGAILREENVIRLRHNGRLYFIDRDIDLIVPTSDRPLSSDKDKLKQRYEERYGIYTGTCDVHVKNNATEEDAVKFITEDFSK